MKRTIPAALVAIMLLVVALYTINYVSSALYTKYDNIPTAIATSAVIARSAEQACGLDLITFPFTSQVVTTTSQHRATPAADSRCLIAGLTNPEALKTWIEKADLKDIVQNVESRLAPEVVTCIKQVDVDYTYSGSHVEYVVRCSRRVILFVDGAHTAILIE